jgi:hypothetical protein
MVINQIMLFFKLKNADFLLVTMRSAMRFSSAISLFAVMARSCSTWNVNS